MVALLGFIRFVPGHSPAWLLLAGFVVGMMAAPVSAADILPTKFTTPNGMTVLLLEQHFLPIVEVHAMVKSGSAQDPPEKAGLANLVASLLDEGTTSRSSKQLAEQIDFVGGVRVGHRIERRHRDQQHGDDEPDVLRCSMNH